MDFFRAESVSHALEILGNIASTSLFRISEFGSSYEIYQAFIFIFVLLVVEWYARKEEFGLSNIAQRVPNKIIRHSLYYAIVLSILWLGGTQQEFIYFQF